MTNKETDHRNLSGYASQVKGTSGIQRIINATGYSKDGFISAYKNEQAFRQVVAINAILLILLFFMPFSMVVKMILVFASFLSLIVELFNTGLEASIDHASTERHPLAKIGKDVGSSAQFLALFLLVILWVMAIFSMG